MQEAERTLALVTSNDKLQEGKGNFSASVVKEAKERIRQYNLIGLETRLQEQHWCDKLISLLKDHVSLHLNTIIADISSKNEVPKGDVNIEHDVIEKVVEAMISSKNLCLSDLENNHELKEIVRVLYVWYKKLSVAEKDGDNYFASLTIILEKLCREFQIPLTDSSIKDEL